MSNSIITLSLIVVLARDCQGIRAQAESIINLLKLVGHLGVNARVWLVTYRGGGGFIIYSAEMNVTDCDECWVLSR